MTKSDTQLNANLQFTYEKEPVHFIYVTENDHIFNVMRRSKSFYERDVLERIRERIKFYNTKGAAVDVGAFIGSHTIYFSKFCGLKPVLAYEANKFSFDFLKLNIERNELEKVIIPVNKALGSEPGFARIVSEQDNNQGNTKIILTNELNNEIVYVTTLDKEIVEKSIEKIALIKIDVEGGELDVLKGAANSLHRHRPILCIEVHEVRNLLNIMALIGKERYWIIDCLGYSPTYVMEATNVLSLRRYLVNYLWVLRALIPVHFSIVRWYLRRLAQISSVGKWDSKPI